MKRFTAIATVLGFAAVGLGATPSRGRAALDNKTDRTFMTTLAQAGMAEIQAGQVAAMRGDKFDRRFGKQMERDHQKAAGQLMTIANHRHMTLPSAPAAADAAEIHRLERMSGAKFATAYHHFAVVSHRQAMSLFRDEIAHGHDAALKSWAERTLPVIREHYREAESMEMR